MLESFLFFHHVHPQDRTQTVRFGGKRLYPPSNSACPLSPRATYTLRRPWLAEQSLCLPESLCRRQEEAGKKGVLAAQGYMEHEF